MLRLCLLTVTASSASALAHSLPMLPRATGVTAPVVAGRTSVPLLLAKRAKRAKGGGGKVQKPKPPPPAAASMFTPGWREVVSDDGDVFYYNAETGVSQWESPIETSVNVPLPPPPAEVAEAPQFGFDAPVASAGDSSSGGGSSAASRRAARRAARRGGGVADGAQPDEPQFASTDSTDAFIEDNSAALDLPSMSDFRAREAPAAERRGGGAIERDALASREASPPAPPSSPQELARDRLFELLTFDKIDGPTAEMVDSEPYDWTARLIGRGLPNKAGVYTLPYLQTGHMLLFGVLLLSSLISYPGFPLTEVPEAYRSLLLQGIDIVLVINSVTAVYARGIAVAKEEPAGFWVAKCVLLGGLALAELSQAVPDPKPKPFPNQRR